MGLEVPDLDDRTYEEIFEDAREELPVHTEEWTDHNAHDPGITVLEMLSWVAETYRYQLDRVTEEHVRTYLQLMGAPPEPPNPASVRLQLRAPAGTKRVTVPAGEKLAVDDGSGSVEVFETVEPIALTGAQIAAVVSEHRDGRTDNTIANGTGDMYFLAFGDGAEEGSAMYLGFDGDPFEATDRLAIDVDFHEANLSEPASHGDEEPTFEPSVRVAWQYCTDYGEWYLDSAWTELEVPEDGDGTNQLYRGGTVVLEEPGGWPGEPARILDREEPLHWIRCTVTRPEYDAPASAGPPEPHYEVPPQIDAVRTNVVTARHRSLIEDETLEPSDDGETTTAWPDQTFLFEHAPVLEDELEVVVGEDDGADPDDGNRWERVEDFDASGPDDRHYVLDHARGAIGFGDGVRGRVPEAGQSVTAVTYVHGGGEAGNVPRSASWRFASDEEVASEPPVSLREVEVTPRGDAEGGTDAEPLEEALLRLKRDLKTPFRTVSPEDYRYVATHTPGLRFGRAKAIVEPGTDVEGCAGHNSVTVVVVPFSTRSRPEPSRGFLDAVDRHLQKHRLLSDRVTVEPPSYVGIGVDAEVGVDPGYSPAGRAAAVEVALEEFLDPLEGFAGEGWPFGRPVYVSELYEVIEGVEGIDCVLDVSIAARGEHAVDDDGSVLLAESALPYPEDHDVVARSGREHCGEGV